MSAGSPADAGTVTRLVAAEDALDAVLAHDAHQLNPGILEDLEDALTDLRAARTWLEQGAPQ